VHPKTRGNKTVLLLNLYSYHNVKKPQYKGGISFDHESVFFVKIGILDICSVPPEQFTEATIYGWLLSAKLIGRNAFLRPNSWT
jgi:hypothetical protein